MSTLLTFNNNGKENESIVQNTLVIEVNKFEKRQITSEKYHECFKQNKRMIKEWSQLLKKTKQGAQKILSSLQNYGIINHENNNCLNDMEMIMNESRAMISHFCSKFDLYENEVKKQYLQLKNTGKELYKIEKFCKDTFKTEKGVYDQFAKKCMDHQQKLTQQQLSKQINFGGQTKSQNSLLHADQSQLLQTNLKFYNSSTQQFIQSVQILYYQLEQQMIISNNTCMNSAKSIKDVLKSLEFDKSQNLIPDSLIERNQQILQEVSTFIARSQIQKNETQNLYSQFNQTQNQILSKHPIFTGNIIASNPYISQLENKSKITNNDANENKSISNAFISKYNAKFESSLNISQKSINQESNSKLQSHTRKQSIPFAVQSNNTISERENAESRVQDDCILKDSNQSKNSKIDHSTKR